MAAGDGAVGVPEALSKRTAPVCQDTPEVPRNWRSSLSRADVAEIVRRRRDGEELAAIAGDFGISVSQVSRIARGKQWKALGIPPVVPPSPEEDFWSRVDKESGPVHPTLGRCWVWADWKTSDGYGGFPASDTPAKKVRAHRRAWELTYGPIDDGLGVLHKCDNPPCVRPDHLFLGTNADNNADMMAKGRSADARGENNGFAKLTDADALEIKRLAAAGVARREIAERFGISSSRVSSIATGHGWNHLDTAEANATDEVTHAVAPRAPGSTAPAQGSAVAPKRRLDIRIVGADGRETPLEVAHG